jgi:5-(carboxyamino)imidazole ribonucleotide synthase
VTSMIPPGSTVGILGGGQLGRMTALAAARLGYRCHIFAPEAEAPAADVAARWTRAAYADLEALDTFAASVAVVTLEWENVDVAALAYLARRVPVRPGAEVLRITQDRLLEKERVRAVGAEVTRFRAVDDEAGLVSALRGSGGRGILKTRRMGYDGKGQVRIEPGDVPADALAAIGNVPAIFEEIVELERELSVITARRADGAMRSFVPVENQHAHHILRRTIAPAVLEPAVAARAIELAEAITQALDVTGLLAVELFLATDGRLLVNELAPRPHNSGHWTIDACAVSQFEQLVRAVCHLPLGDPAPLMPAEMENLLGGEWESWPALLAEPGARLHLYGKGRAAPGRKMGHVTRLGPLAVRR